MLVALGQGYAVTESVETMLHTLDLNSPRDCHDSVLVSNMHTGEYYALMA